MNRFTKVFGRVRYGLAIFSAVALVCLSPTFSYAAVFSAGDVTPQQTFTDVNIGGQEVDITAPDLPTGGGRVENGADIVVGGTGVFSGNITLGIGTTIGEVTINNPSGTLPLIAPNVTIGMQAHGRGRINVNDFGTTLVAENQLIVGDEGEGELRLTNGAVAGVGVFNDSTFRYEEGTTIIGSQRDTAGTNQFLSEGLVTIDGFGSVLETEELFVADEGFGTIEISGKGKLLTVDTTLGEEADSLGRISVSGLNTRWTNVDELIVGNFGTGLLEVNDFAVVVSDDISVGMTSFVSLAGGRLVSNTAIVTNGVISGSGRIESSITVNGTGEIRNAASIANLRERLLVTGPVVNDGTIQSLGGEMEFESLVINTREVIARDAVMYFPAGLVSSGSISIGGDSTLHGPISNSGGSILVLADSEAEIIGDLTFTGGALSLTIGDAAGTLDVIGEISLSDVELELDYSAGIASQEGDTYQILSSTETITGTFDNTGDLVDADGREWMITGYGTNTLFVTATSDLVGPLLGDFDLDDDVDGADFLSWQRGVPSTPPNGGDLNDWEQNFGTRRDPIVLAAVNAVPEPATLALALLTLACCPWRQARS